MKPSEFYEKYFRVMGSDGKVLPVKPLTKKEKEWMDSEESRDFNFTLYKRKVGLINAKAICKLMQQFPEFMKKEIK